MSEPCYAAPRRPFHPPSGRYVMNRLLMGFCLVLSGALASCATSTPPPNSSLSSMGAAAPHAELAPAPPPTPTVKSKNAFRGAPISTNTDSVYVFLKNKGYDIGYSESRKDPLWAAYTFRKDVDQFDVKRPKSKKFASDNRVNSGVTDSGLHQQRLRPRPHGPQAMPSGAGTATTPRTARSSSRTSARRSTTTTPATGPASKPPSPTFTWRTSTRSG